MVEVVGAKVGCHHDWGCGQACGRAVSLLLVKKDKRVDDGWLMDMNY
jgi:hypothetical protein